MIRSFGWLELLILLRATEWTLALSLIAFVGGGAFGFVVALARVSPRAILRALAIVYIELMQATPVLMVLFLVFYGLGLLGFDIPPLVAASAAMIVYCAAFLGDIWRGCIEAIPKQQWEASEALAMTRWQQLRYVVLPQAARISLPSTVGFLVQVVKTTSVASIIGMVELTQAGRNVNNATFQPFKVFIAVALIYFVLCYPLSLWSQALERRMLAGRRA
jgi:polar amino acid transport system permease protein